MFGLFMPHMACSGNRCPAHSQRRRTPTLLGCLRSGTDISSSTDLPVLPPVPTALAQGLGQGPAPTPTPDR